MKHLILLGIVISVLISSCKKENTESPSINRGLNIFFYEGSAWTGWSYELNIDSTGLMAVYEKNYLPQVSERKNNYVLLTEELDSLKHDIDKLSAIRLRNYGFGPDKPTDLPTSFLKYRLNSSSDSSGIYCPIKGEIPNELSITLGRINKLRIKYDNK
jgi:hypothetical protein